MRSVISATRLWHSPAIFHGISSFFTFFSRSRSRLTLFFTLTALGFGKALFFCAVFDRVHYFFFGFVRPSYYLTKKNALQFISTDSLFSETLKLLKDAFVIVFFVCSLLFISCRVRFRCVRTLRRAFFCLWSFFTTFPSQIFRFIHRNFAKLNFQNDVEL